MVGFRHNIALASTVAASVSLGALLCMAEPRQPAPLQLEATIELGQVRGRIDHLAIDLARNRLFVAQLGDDTIGVIDLAARKVIHTIRGLRTSAHVTRSSSPVAATVRPASTPVRTTLN
jgi:YVTN family beta-propeller protein